MSLTLVVTALKAEFRVLQGSWDVSPEEAAEILRSLGEWGKGGLWYLPGEALRAFRAGPSKERCEGQCA